MKIFKAVTLGLLSLSVLLPGQIHAQSDTQDVSERSEIIEQYLNLMNNRSNDTTFDKRECFQKILKRGVSGCDKYSAIFNEEDMEQFKGSLGGSYSGVGMAVNKNEAGHVVVMSVFPGAPADSVGLRPGDIIVQVDTTKLDESYSIAEVVALIKGPKGTTVSITVRRDDDLVGPVDIVRRETHAPSTDIATVNSDIGYVRISQFTKHLPEEVDTAMDSLSDMGVQGFVLDLRDNPGGYLDEVVSVLHNEFSPKNNMRSVTIVGRKGKKKEKHFSTAEGDYGDVPIVVLVNERSASASEIMAGTLQDWSVAEVVGDTTFGKGSVQTLFTFEADSGSKYWAKITTAEYFVGNSMAKVNGIGVMPDHVVDDSLVDSSDYYTEFGNLKTDLENDAQLKKAVEILKEKIKP